MNGLTCYSDTCRPACLCNIPELYKAVILSSLVQGSDIYQKSVIYCSVVAISFFYLVPVSSASCTAVKPPVADYLTSLRKSCHIKDQKDSCSQGERISNVHLSSSIVNCNLPSNISFSCELCKWQAITPPLPPSLAFRHNYTKQTQTSNLQQLYIRIWEACLPNNSLTHARWTSQFTDLNEENRLWWMPVELQAPLKSLSTLSQLPSKLVFLCRLGSGRVTDPFMGFCGDIMQFCSSMSSTVSPQ